MSKVWTCENEIPAFAGMAAFNLTPSTSQQRHPRECGDLLQEMPRRDNEIPAFAGITFVFGMTLFLGTTLYSGKDVCHLLSAAFYQT